MPYILNAQKGRFNVRSPRASKLRNGRDCAFFSRLNWLTVGVRGVRSAIRSKDTPDLSKYEIFDLEINASPAVVWSLLTTYEEVPKVFGFITRIKRLRQTGPILLLEQEVQPLPPVPAIKYTVEVTEEKEVKLSWDGRTPYIKVNKGFFKLESLEGGTKTHVTFACWAEAALLVPVFVVRLQQKIIMPRVLQILQEHAEKK